MGGVHIWPHQSAIQELGLLVLGVLVTFLLLNLSCQLICPKTISGLPRVLLEAHTCGIFLRQSYQIPLGSAELGGWRKDRLSPITSSLRDVKKVYSLAWRHLLKPCFQRRVKADATGTDH